MAPTLNQYLKESINAKVKLNLPSILPSFTVRKLKLGMKPPAIRYILIQNYDQILTHGKRKGHNAVQSATIEAVNNGTQQTEIFYIETGMEFLSRDSLIIAKFGAPEMGNNMWKTISSILPGCKIKISSVQFQGKLSVALQIKPEFPYLEKLWISFLDGPPRIKFELEALAGIDIASLPFLRKILKQSIEKVIDPFCDPR
mmetsp:Transcript_4458/g.6775  ORF Transcript_4458/g.6775 Transcript_4458/m.6775 type:complete len:200 (+) Transcript_4458:98-697(+)